MSYSTVTDIPLKTGNLTEESTNVPVICGF